MILLAAATDFLELQTQSATSVDWSASYVDISTTETVFNPGAAVGNVAAAVSTTIAGSPPDASTQRQIKFLSVVNRAGSAQTVVIDKNSAAVQYNLTPAIVLQAGEMLTYVDGVGFQVFTALGQVKEAIANITGPTGAQGPNAPFIVPEDPDREDPIVYSPPMPSEYPIFRQPTGTATTDAGPGSMQNGNVYISWNSTQASPKTQTIPTSTGTGNKVTVFDQQASAATNNITITPTSGTVLGAANNTNKVTTNNGKVTLVDTPYGWAPA